MITCPVTHTLGPVRRAGSAAKQPTPAMPNVMGLEQLASGPGSAGH
jgi:hypothetical protein